MRWTRSILTLIAAMAMPACSAQTDIRAAEAGVTKFHNQYNASQIGQIYAASGPAMKEAISEPEFAKFLGAVRTKLGAFKDGKTVGWHVNVGTGGTQTTLTRQATFERGAATEQFIFQGSGDGTQLAGYHINSAALITN